MAHSSRNGKSKRPPRATTSALWRVAAEKTPSCRSVSRGHGLIKARNPRTQSVSRTLRQYGLASYSYSTSSGVGVALQRVAMVLREAEHDEHEN